MFRKRTKNDVQTEYKCSVRYLDDEPLQLTFKKDTLGQWLFDQVCEKLNLMEKDYFGLRYVDSEKQRHWLDPLKTVYKQLKGVNPMVLCFRVKFYPEDPMKLLEEITRYYLFLQLRRDLHHGRLLCTPDDAVVLAAYIVQSEVGDYDPEDHPPGYISEFKMLPKQTPKLEERVMELHKLFRGQVPSEAESNFLKKAKTLDTYGVDPHQVKDQRGDQLYLGITHQGIMTFRGSRRTQLYKWNQIRRIAYEGKMFLVHISVVNEDDDAVSNKKKQHPVGYKCLTAAAAKYLWRCAVEQQLFFTLASSGTAPKMRSGGTLFSRGSRFRFSGRCQTEAYAASEFIQRSEPNFQRSSSLPNFARKKSEGSANRASLSSQRDSPLNNSTQDERRPYSEAPVDVRPLSKGKATDSPQVRPTSELEPSPVMKAPLAHVEKYDEQHAATQAAAAAAAAVAVVEDEVIATTINKSSAAPPQRLNGQVVRDGGNVQADEGGDADTSLYYQPNQTFYEDDEDEEEPDKPRPSLDEEIQRLDEHFKHVEQNHVSSADSINKAVASNQASAVSKPPKSRSGGVCKSVILSVVVSLVLFSVLFYLLYFSGLQHPWLSQAKQHLSFLEPARDFVAAKAQNIAKYFQK